MPNPPKRARFVPMESWTGRHQTYKQKIEGLHSFQVHHPPNNPAALLKAYNAATKELQGLIAQAVKEKKTLRAHGSSWSLSKVAVSEHRLLSTKALRIRFTLPASQISPNYAHDRSKLRFLECGYSISEINRVLFQDGLSLKASGSNNGQTLPGVISTGTHGSAFKFGATQDFVVGIHLITGPNKHVYLERASHPVTKPSFAKALGAELIRDDTLFDAALVSFGSVGIIHGLMIEARDLFLLDAYRSYRKFNPGLRKAITTLDFSGLTLPKPASKLYHFQATINPNDAIPAKRATVLLMFERPWTDAYQPPDWDDGAAGPGASGLELMGGLLDLLPSEIGPAVKPLINMQVDDALAPYEVTGTIRDLFRGEKTTGKVFASGVGVPLARSLDVLNIALETYENFGRILPMLITLRFVKGTKALLGFTRYEPTCVLEIDGLFTPQSQKYVNQVWGRLEQAGIPFTMHWGKINSFMTKARVRKMYGGNVDTWIDSRETLLDSPAVREVFANGFIRRIGLAT
ncbi:MAG: hypothetical protein MI806_25435 [Minwuiales bacterium]|nr:hypothetical protein [Minwuiales bacterium]